MFCSKAHSDDFRSKISLANRIVTCIVKNYGDACKNGDSYPPLKLDTDTYKVLASQFSGFVIDSLFSDLICKYVSEADSELRMTELTTNEAIESVFGHERKRGPASYFLLNGPRCNVGVVVAMGNPAIEMTSMEKKSPSSS